MDYLLLGVVFLAVMSLIYWFYDVKKQKKPVEIDMAPYVSPIKRKTIINTGVSNHNYDEDTLELIRRTEAANKKLDKAEEIRKAELIDLQEATRLMKESTEELKRKRLNR